MIAARLIVALVAAGAGSACASTAQKARDCAQRASGAAAAQDAAAARESDLAFVVSAPKFRAVYAVGADGSRLRRLMSVRHGYVSNVAWSPNGREIALERARGFGARHVEVWIAHADDSGAPRLLAPASRGARWSPDGSKIVLERWIARESRTDIGVLDREGRGGKSLTSGRAADFDPAWSPDGQTIAFRRGGALDQGDIWAVNADGSCLRNLTPGGPDDSAFSWSPDGTKVAFLRKRSLFVVAADGTQTRRLTTGLHVRDDYDWSPDGKRIAVIVGWPLAKRELYVVGTDGSGPLRLTDNHAEERGPVWSPDGTHIAFMSWPEETYEIHTIEADGTDERRLTRGTWDYYPEWSADGTRIAFSRDDYGGEGPGRIWVIDAGGSGARELTRRFREGFFGPWAWGP